MATAAKAFEQPHHRTAANWSGLFDTVPECDKAVTDIEGKMPAGLVGTLYRNGPGTREFAKSYFDGDGLLRVVDIKDDGSVRYRARYVQTEKYLAERGSDRPLRRQAGTNLPGGVLRNMFRAPGHEANTHIFPFAGSVWALSEGGHPYEIDLDTLSTGSMNDFDGHLGKRTAFTAHPHVDPDSGDIFAFGNHFAGLVPTLRIFRIDPSGRFHDIGVVSMENAGFVHDYGLSKKWMAFYMPPMVPSLGRFLLGFDTFFDSMKWRPELGTKIALMSRDGGEPIYLETEAFMPGHVLSAWDEGDELIVDSCQLEAWSNIGDSAANYKSSDWSGYSKGTIRRHRINPTTRTVTSEEICSLPAEFPRINDRMETHGARYAYCAANPRSGEGGWFHALLKLDCHGGEEELFDFGPDAVVQEPVFVPRDPMAGEEDEGWVVCFVHDGGERQTEVAIFDARGVGDGPICVLKLHENAGATFHGSWIPA